jgi:putative ABC transport system substrate-binding protein
VAEQVRRREFLGALGGAVVLPLAARAQQQGELPTIGFLAESAPSNLSQRNAAFKERLRDLGWIEGRSVAIEQRWAEGRYLEKDKLVAKKTVTSSSPRPAKAAAKKALTQHAQHPEKP